MSAMELRELKEIENNEDASYLRFSHFPIARTKTYADGEVNVDLDHCGEVVGIEVLSYGAEELKALGEIVKEYQLRTESLRFARTR